MERTTTWRGRARLAFADGRETGVVAVLHRNGAPAGWAGELILEGPSPVAPGDRVDVTVGRSTRSAIVRGAAVRGGAGHRTTTLAIEGDGPPPSVLTRTPGDE